MAASTGRLDKLEAKLVNVTQQLKTQRLTFTHQLVSLTGRLEQIENRPNSKCQT